jgi:hypothetical protein
MVAAIAFESLVKLIAFVAVGAFVTFGIYNGFGDIFDRAEAVPKLKALMTVADTGASYGSWWSLTFLSMLSIMFLPRQFQISVVENVNERHLARAIWLFPLYLLVINVFVLPIAVGGMMHFTDGSVDADTFVLTLPMAERQEALALLVYIGGLSAGTGMVIVETIALSTMVCNDLVMPVLLRWKALRLHEERDLSGLLLSSAAGRSRPSSCSATSISARPARLMRWSASGSSRLPPWRSSRRPSSAASTGRAARARAPFAGLVAGFAVWIYTLLLPSFAKSGWLSLDFISEGLFGIALLKPQQLFGLSGLGEIPHSLFWSMLANIGCYVAVSLRGGRTWWRPARARCSSMLSQHRGAAGSRFWRGSAQVQDLLPLIGRFLGPGRRARPFSAYARRRGVATIDALEANADLVHYAETLLAGAIGGASARVMVASVVKEEPLGIDEVMNILDEASQVRAYSKQLEQKSRELEAATAELRAANERLKELDRMKDDFMSTVTHELRTPLTSIRAFSEILLEDPKTNLASTAESSSPSSSRKPSA